MKIKIITVGRVKEVYLQQGINEFSKRLFRFCKLELVQVKDSVIDKEGKEILEKIENEYVILLDVSGKQWASFEFSEFLKRINKDITFVIGSEKGLSGILDKRADFKLSLSRMTFLHEMSQLILLEQVYRAFSIIKNTGYHK